MQEYGSTQAERCEGVRSPILSSPHSIAAPREAGFTLVELLVVVAIIALLAAMLFPVFAAARERGRMAVCASNLRQIGVAFELYLDDYDGLYPCTGNLLLWQGRYWRWPMRSYIGLGSNPVGGNPLISDRKERNILLCPSDTTAEARYDCTSYAYSMCFYFGPDQINAMTSFGDTVTPPGPPCTPQHESAVRHAAQKALVTEWTSNHETPHVGWHSPSTAWHGGRNYLFADGHVKYVKARQINPANDNLPDINLTRDGIRGKDLN